MDDAGSSPRLRPPQDYNPIYLRLLQYRQSDTPLSQYYWMHQGLE